MLKGMEGAYLSIIKAVYDELIANILSGENLKALLLIYGTRHDYLLFLYLSNLMLEVLEQEDKRRKWKE